MATSGDILATTVVGSYPQPEWLGDGEMRRESYSNRFATALDGMDIEHPGTAIDRTGHPNPVPRVTGPIRRTRPIEVDDLRFLRRNTDRRGGITPPRPPPPTPPGQKKHHP